MIVVLLIYWVKLERDEIRVYELNNSNAINVVNNGSEIERINYNKDKNYEISFEFKFYGFKNNFENIFQTSKINDGIRLELANASTGIWGVVFPGNVIALENIPTINTWHKFNLNIKDGNLSIYIDNELKYKGVLQDDALKFKTDDIAVGTGFSKERPFNGEVKNFKFLESKNSKVLKYYPVITFNIFLILLLIVNKEKNIKNFFYIGIKDKRMIFEYIAFSMMALCSIIILKGSLVYNKVFYCEIILLAMISIYYFFKKINFQNIGVTSILASGFIILKNQLINASILGVFSDILLVFTITYIIRLFNYKFRFEKKINYMITFVLVIISTLIFVILSLFSIYAMKINLGSNSKNLFNDELLAIFQTNIQEAYEFIITFFSFNEIFFIVMFTLFIAFLSYVNIASFNNIQFKNLRMKIIICNILILLFATACLTFISGVGQSILNPMIRLGAGYKQSMEQMAYYQNLRKNNHDMTASKSGKGETYVIVIGESSNKRHYSSYGYFRNTTPWLNTLRNDNNTIFLENAYAPYVHTVPALMKILTSANQYNKEIDFTSPSIIEIARKAGFKTYWFSNQNRYGLGDNPLTILAEAADEVYFTPRTGLDGELCNIIQNKIKEIDKNSNNIIFVHMIGSHAEYTSRIPKNYSTQWKESGIEYLGNNARDPEFVSKILDPYDATIKYTDENLKKIYETVKSAVNDLTAFVYLPDHGEDVYGKKFHNASIFTFEMTRVPFFTVFSDSWKNTNVDKFKSLKNNSMDPFSTDLLFDYVLGITGIKSDLYNDKYDISSYDYMINWDNAVTMWSDNTLQTNLYAKTRTYYLAEDPLFIKKQNILKLNNKYGNKFLALCNDAIGSALESLQLGFKGFEVNVTVTEKDIKIGHGPEEVYDITLDEFLSRVPLNAIDKLWIDMKLEDEQLITNALEYFKMLDEKYNIKDKVVIESSLIDIKMQEFTNSGWKYMFYLQPRLNNIECPVEIQNIVENKSGKKVDLQINDSNYDLFDVYANNISTILHQQKPYSFSFWYESKIFVDRFIKPKNSWLKYGTFAIPEMALLSDKDFMIKSIKILEDIENSDGIEYVLIDSESTYVISLN